VRRLLLSLLVLVAGCSTSRPAAPPKSTTGRVVEGRPESGPAGAAAERIAVRAVGCVGVTVSSLARATDFYTRVLAFRERGERTLDRARRVRLDLGRECVELSEPLKGVRRPIPTDSQSNDRWFQHVAIVVSDIDAAYARLEAHQVAHISVAPQTLPAWNRDAANIRAYYFKDPDGHTLELIWFPPDKGQARWHAPSASLFLGIDHTAIASGDTRASLAFYVRRLGLHVAGGSENYGLEQERLNAVPGAHLRITTLRADDGPGVELLEYLAPRTGRAMPSDEQAEDLIHWRTTMFADGIDGLRSLRDPDGHLMELHMRGEP
jgi:catechol 2,3-dioxygenase-like lactoylglutathione lyase family enzyme